MNATPAKLKATFITAWFQYREDLYQGTQNPIHAWLAYMTARKAGVATPEWVLTYLDLVATALTAPDGVPSAQTAAKALGLATRGGPSKSSRTKSEERNRDVLGRIAALQRLVQARATSPLILGHDLRDFPGSHLTDTGSILQHVAEEVGLSVERVQAIYYQGRRSAPHPKAAHRLPTQKRTIRRRTQSRVEPPRR